MYPLYIHDMHIRLSKYQSDKNGNHTHLTNTFSGSQYAVTLATVSKSVYFMQQYKKYNMSFMDQYNFCSRHLSLRQVYRKICTKNYTGFLLQFKMML